MLSVHVVDIARGSPAAGMKIDWFRRERGELVHFATTVTDVEGKTELDETAIANLALPLSVRLQFHIDAYFAGTELQGSSHFIDVQPFDLVLPAGLQRCHLPAKITPFGFELFLTLPSRGENRAGR